MKTNLMLTAPALVCGLGLVATGMMPAAALADTQNNNSQGDDGSSNSRALVHHVLLISVDGLHQSDLDWYVQTHPQSTLAAMAARGVDYSDASTPFPSDSFPGMVGQVTGGNPSSTGISMIVPPTPPTMPGSSFSTSTIPPPALTASPSPRRVFTRSMRGRRQQSLSASTKVIRGCPT
jgi:hypothetical protein